MAVAPGSVGDFALRSEGAFEDGMRNVRGDNGAFDIEDGFSTRAEREMLNRQRRPTRDAARFVLVFFIIVWNRGQAEQ